ncbi:OFA family oxalate/formate antiporter-like MFS transporter [Sporomusaceae bacterium BoRhaA]|uniref:L-lactate MFS transporter n=1 Tax=Pelorhabdus rhamnosifermentans TaxID=2772457 RepID=UPI001C060627|nr:OFA family MFS transporter [Pelorhabdus rhamnosifermentans]MBU2702334.1 OFA family oxalate/formate antiporter-like MFS transporter [Pelorhabdus rhamnosifermentans]
MSEQHYNRWLILVAAIVINICCGTLYAWSVFALPLGKLFGWPATAIALAFTITHGLSPVAMIGGGYIQDRLGCKANVIIGGIMFGAGLLITGFISSIEMLYISYSVLAGIGGGVIYSGTLGNTVKFFPDKQGLASGLVAAGYGSGATIVAPIASAMISNIGVLDTFKILGVVFLAIILVGSCFIKKAPAGFKPAGWEPPLVANNAKQVVTDKVWHQMLRDGTWWVVLVILIFGALSGLMITSAASPIGQQMFQLTPMIAALFLSLISISNALGRIVFGAASDHIGRSNTLIVMYVISALCMLNLALTGSVVGFAVSGIGIGAVFGGFMSTMPGIITERYGFKNFGVNYGITFIGFSLAAIFGPMIAATVRESTGTYNNAFWIALGLNILGLIAAYIFRTLDQRRKKAIQNDSSMKTV